MKMIKIMAFGLLMSCWLCTACEDDKVEEVTLEPELEIQESVNCDWKGTPAGVSVKTNQTVWLARVEETAKDWCVFVPRRDSILITPSENQLEQSREALIFITAGGLTDTLRVIQEAGAQPYCRVSESKMDFVWLENTLQTEVVTNQTTWGAELKNAPWCTMKIVGNQIFVTAERNNGTAPQNGELVIKAGRAEPVVVPLVQEGKKAVVAGEVSFVVPAQFNVSGVYEVWNGDQKIAEICQEYVPRVDDKNPIVVVYPLLGNGKPDLLKGFVTADGGRLAWEAAGVVYTAGDQPAPVKEIAFGGGELSAVVGAGTPQVSVAPALLKDIENNRYRIVKIGTQFWLGDNLRTTTYADGTTISKDYTSTNGAWGWFEDRIVGQVDRETVGLLYNWYALDRLAPQGWHVPGIGEWESLQEYLGDTDAVLMRKLNGGWDSPCNANNLSGFAALPGGTRWDTGKYQTGSAREDGSWWAVEEDEDDDKKAYYLTMRFNSDKTTLTTFKKNFSYSVRLIRD